MLVYVKGVKDSLALLKWEKGWFLLIKDVIWINYAKIHQRNQKSLHQNGNKILEQLLQ